MARSVNKISFYVRCLASIEGQLLHCFLETAFLVILFFCFITISSFSFDFLFPVSFPLIFFFSFFLSLFFSITFFPSFLSCFVVYFSLNHLPAIFFFSLNLFFFRYFVLFFVALFFLFPFSVLFFFLSFQDPWLSFGPLSNYCAISFLHTFFFCPRRSSLRADYYLGKKCIDTFNIHRYIHLFFFSQQKDLKA